MANPHAQKNASPAKQRRVLICWSALLVGVIAVAVALFCRAPHKLNNSITTSPSAYAGSASCRECHAEAYNNWAKSHHALAERPPNPLMENAAFIPPRLFKHGTQETSLRATNGRFELITAGRHGTNEIFPVERVLAENPLRQMLVQFPGGRVQVTEAAFDPRSNEWFNVYGNEDRQPGEWGHWTGRGMNWNSMCATCHNMQVRKNYDAATDSYDTKLVEHGVGCES